MDEVRNQLELTNEISQAISDPAGMGIDVRTLDIVSGSLTVEKADNHVSLRWTTRSWRTSWQSSSRKSSTSGWQVPRQHRSIHQPRRSLRVSPASPVLTRPAPSSLTECLPCSQDSGSEDRGGRGRGRVGHVNGRHRHRPSISVPCFLDSARDLASPPPT
jgi:hypothetical protein